VSINYYGRGFGPLSTITVNSQTEGPVTFLAGGRSVDQLGNGDFGGGFGGRISLNPMISIRDSHRQTAADWMQLVRVIQTGIDVEEDGVPDLDPSRIYYFGNSLGGLMGPLFMAVEPDVHAGVLNAFGGAQSTNTLLSSARAPNWGAFLAQRQPSLINGPGVTRIDGVPASGPFFNENLPLRDGVPLAVRLADGTDAIIQAPVINTVPGAMEIQEVVERREWIMMAGEAVAYAPHLRKSPLAGVPAKSMIIQFAKGDTNQLNPTTSAYLRAGDLADRATFYRHDLAFAEDPTLDRNPHQFLIRVVGNPGERRIGLGYQSQIAAFFASDGKEIIHPEPARFFETPIAGSLPERLNFIVTDPPIITIADASVTEGDGGIHILTFTVALTRASAQPVSVHYGTADGTANVGEDYEPASGTLVFAPGETTKTITVVIKGDKEEEGKETFFIKLWQADNALLLEDLALGAILNDD
jgi:Calx-beta domain